MKPKTKAKKRRSSMSVSKLTRQLHHATGGGG